MPAAATSEDGDTLASLADKVGHGLPDGLGTGGGLFDYNPKEEWIKYEDAWSRLRYKLGTVVLWVCYGGGSGDQSLSSLAGEYVFDGVDRTLYPFLDYTPISELFANGKQGTKVP